MIQQATGRNFGTGRLMTYNASSLLPQGESIVTKLNAEQQLHVVKETFDRISGKYNGGLGAIPKGHGYSVKIGKTAPVLEHNPTRGNFHAVEDAQSGITVASAGSCLNILEGNSLIELYPNHDNSEFDRLLESTTSFVKEIAGRKGQTLCIRV